MTSQGHPTSLCETKVHLSSSDSLFLCFLNKATDLIKRQLHVSLLRKGNLWKGAGLKAKDMRKQGYLGAAAVSGLCQPGRDGVHACVCGVGNKNKPYLFVFAYFSVFIFFFFLQSLSGLHHSKQTRLDFTTSFCSAQQSERLVLLLESVDLLDQPSFLHSWW